MPSIEVGKLISKQRWETAVKVALRAPSHSCSPLEKAAKKAFRRGGARPHTSRLFASEHATSLPALCGSTMCPAASLSFADRRCASFSFGCPLFRVQEQRRDRGVSRVPHAGIDSRGSCARPARGAAPNAQVLPRRARAARVALGRPRPQGGSAVNAARQGASSRRSFCVETPAASLAARSSPPSILVFPSRQRQCVRPCPRARCSR
jgi:hypothetical protein